MSDKEKLIASLEDKGFLDQESVEFLRKRLRGKLKSEAEKQKKEMTLIKKEILTLQARMIN